MAAIQFNDGGGLATLRNVYPAPADRFSNWTPITKPYGDSVTTLATGATVMFRHRTDYGASFELQGLGVRNAPAPRGLTFVVNPTGGSIPAGTYYVVATAILASGETGPSVEGSFTTTGSTSQVTFNLTTTVAGATGYRYYIGTAPGGENSYFAVSPGPALTIVSVSGTAGSPNAAGTNLVALADRLIAHLLGGGSCAVYLEDVLGNSYVTCGLYPGTTPSLRLTDSRLLLYTLSLQVINLAASPVRMDAVYAP